MENVPKSTEKKRHYCSVCSNFRGKVVDGKPITLHKFPAHDILKKTWVRRIKTVMKTFVLTKNSRICSAHFEGGKMTNDHNIPSIFDLKSRRKIFATSKVTPVEFIPMIEPEDDGPYFATKLEDFIADLMIPTSECDQTLENEQMETTFIDHEEATDPDENESIHFFPSSSRELTSVNFHDYCGLPNTDGTTKLNKTIQAEEGTYYGTLIIRPKETKDQGTQTFVTTKSTLSQTETESEVQFKSKSCSVSTQASLPDITFEDISNQDEDVMFYTGLPNAGTFHALFDMLDDASIQTERKGTASGKSGRPRSLRLIDEFFLILMRLRLGLLVEDLAYRFHISKSTCSSIISRWIDYLHIKLSCLIVWPSKTVIRETMPQKFRKRYPNCRVIIDCTEIYTETPQSLINKSLMYSHYKSHMTYKALLGISPSGIITFASDLWAGSISDKQITKNSGLLDICEKGDAIMGDKGFLIADLTTAKGIHLIVPPLKLKRFTRRQVEETRRIANLRIDVERAMERVKNFRILQGVIPISLAPQANKYWKLCVALSNMHPPLVNDD